MMIQINILPEKNVKEQEIQKSTTVGDVIKSMHIKPDTVIAMRDNTPIPIDETIKEGDKITIIKVSSGG